jgi:histidine ammonia-lyase
MPDARDRMVQDPYPFRVLPQVDGVMQGALWGLDQVVNRELNARPENALIEAGRTLPTGNFHNAELAAALDSARNALAQSASLIAARVSALLDPRMTGLPPFLARSPGKDSGMMMLEYTAQSAAAEIRSLAMPSGTQTTWASLGIESHASLSSIAVRRTADALDALRILAATEMVVALRAIRHAGRTPAGAGTQRLFELADELLPEGLEDRAFGRDVDLACTVLDRWASQSGVDRRLADAP